MIKTTQELTTGDIVLMANKSARTIEFIRQVQGDLFAITYGRKDGSTEFSYEWANTSFKIIFAN
jgi:hypothetical protein